MEVVLVVVLEVVVEVVEEEEEGWEEGWGLGVGAGISPGGARRDRAPPPPPGWGRKVIFGPGTCCTTLCSPESETCFEATGAAAVAEPVVGT